ncbi:MAG: DEAD/DEAH box helicase [Solirubrobacteraceae bacterium]
MFNRGINELLEALPEFEGLDGTSVKRLLTTAYLEGFDLAEIASDEIRPDLTAQLRRLVTALEIHAILVPNVDQPARRACAFVAAESLTLLGGLVGAQEGVGREPFPAFGSRERYRRVEAGLLYVIAAFDANAVIAVRDIEGLPVAPSDGDDLAQTEAMAADWVMREVLALIRLSAPRGDALPVGPGVDGDRGDVRLVPRVRIALWRRVGEIVRGHLRWLRLEDDAPVSGAAEALQELGELLEHGFGAAYADVAHLARLLRFVCDETAGRAMRAVPPPDGDPSVFIDYQRRRCRTKPLLWPSAERFRERCLPGPASHAAIAMPTGSGKSAVAEVAVAQALSRGWVVYIAPTRALVRQIRRDLRRALGPGIDVREFLGGAEFTALADDSIGPDPGHSVLVMTPEKCSLALRQSPEAFATLALCVFDECHLIGEPGNRGVLAELVMAQLLQLAPEVSVVMQSALLANPEEIADWLRHATGRDCAAIREPWRPTRTLRAVAGFDAPGLAEAQQTAGQELLALPGRVHLEFEAPLNLLVNLQGAWAQDDEQDYALVHTTLAAPMTVSRVDDEVILKLDGYVNRATGAIAQGLVEAGHRVLAFIPANKHYSFSVARDLAGFGDQADRESETWQSLERLLDLAEFELGTASLLRSLLAKGVAVNTSAMLYEERQASELAYERGLAKVVFATGTLAQGLNLPATAVVIGGLTIGFDPDLSAAERSAREQALLLNAVGRAGRPYVAARSLAVVIPNDVWELGPEDRGEVVRNLVAPFLAEEDASVALRSQLGPLVREALAGELTVESMGVEGLTAFAFLPLRSDADEAIGILGRTLAVARRPDTAQEQVEVVATAMVRLGEQVLEAQAAPDWLVEAAYDSGLSLRQVVAMWVELRTLDHSDFPDTISEWAQVMTDRLARMPYDIVAEMLPLRSFEGTRMRALADPLAVTRHPAAWSVFDEFLQGWLDATSLTDLAAIAVKANAAGKDGRGSGNPLPKIIGLSEQILLFGMTRIAGGLAVLVETAVRLEPDLGWELTPQSARALEQLSLGVRAGCGDAGSLTWWRFGGVRHRRLAHLAARLMPAPDAALGTDEAASGWALSARPELLDPEFFLDDDHGLDDGERSALVAFVLSSDA